MDRFLVALSLLGGCFSPQFDECAIQCGVGCPIGWTCEVDGFCHGADDERSCVLPAGPDAEADASTAADAAPMLIDAACGRFELLTNGDFDDSTGTGVMKTVPGWSTIAFIGAMVIHESEAEAVVHSPAYAAQVVNENGQVGELCQRLTVPAGGKEVELAVWYAIETEEVSAEPYDVLRISLRSLAGTLLAEPLRLSNVSAAPGWTRTVAPIAIDLGGQTVDLCVKGTNDPTLPTTFHLDDLELTVHDCP